MSEIDMNKPLKPKASAVWLIENTTLSFDQIAEFREVAANAKIPVVQA